MLLYKKRFLPFFRNLRTLQGQALFRGQGYTLCAAGASVQKEDFILFPESAVRVFVQKENFVLFPESGNITASGKRAKFFFCTEALAEECILVPKIMPVAKITE